MKKSTRGITSTADACDYGLWIFYARFFPELPFYLCADHTLKPGYHIGVRMRTDPAPNSIVGVIGVIDPVPDRLVGSVFQGLTAAGGRHYPGTQHFHSGYIGRLPLNILFTHVNNTFQSLQSTHSCSGNTVLSGTCFCDNSFFAKFLCK